MNFDETGREFNFNFNIKKIIFVILLVIGGMWVLREIAFWAFFHEVKQTVNQFNQQFDKGQQAIGNKIDRDMDDFDQEDRKFHAKQDEFERDVDKQMETMQKYQDQVIAEHAARDKELDKIFAELPQKMMKEHDEMAKKIRQDFLEGSHHLQDEYVKEVDAAQKEEAATRKAYAKERARLDHADEKKQWANHDKNSPSSSNVPSSALLTH
jgi:uncharacterized protein YoxC